MDRRLFLGASASGLLWLAGCGRSDLPEGMEEIHWDRDTCARCRMVISDRRFATEVRGGPKGELFKFDDIGCAMIFLRDLPGGQAPATRIWVADATQPTGNSRWLDAPKAFYLAGRHSPMGYNFAAQSDNVANSIGFDQMRQQVLALGK